MGIKQLTSVMLSFPRKRLPADVVVARESSEYNEIPAFAGMTGFSGMTNVSASGMTEGLSNDDEATLLAALKALVPAASLFVPLLFAKFANSETPIDDGGESEFKKVISEAAEGYAARLHNAWRGTIMTIKGEAPDGQPMREPKWEEVERSDEPVLAKVPEQFKRDVFKGKKFGSETWQTMADSDRVNEFEEISSCLEIDIANLPFALLPDKFKRENTFAAEGAMKIISAYGHFALQAGTDIVTVFIDEAADIIHEQWLERNGSWAQPEQNRPYSEDEQNKDRIIVLGAVDHANEQLARNDLPVRIVAAQEESIILSQFGENALAVEKRRYEEAQKLMEAKGVLWPVSRAMSILLEWKSMIEDTSEDYLNEVYRLIDLCTSEILPALQDKMVEELNRMLDTVQKPDSPSKALNRFLGYFEQAILLSKNVRPEDVSAGLFVPTLPGDIRGELEKILFEGWKKSNHGREAVLDIDSKDGSRFVNAAELEWDILSADEDIKKRVLKHCYDVLDNGYYYGELGDKRGFQGAVKKTNAFVYAVYQGLPDGDPLKALIRRMSMYDKGGSVTMAVVRDVIWAESLKPGNERIRNLFEERFVNELSEALDEKATRVRDVRERAKAKTRKL